MDDKSAYIAKNPSDGVANALKVGDVDFFAIVWKLLLIRTTFTISSSEAEIAASEIRRLKTAFISTIKDGRENDLNLSQIYIIANVNVEEIV